jgi:hypothetical protein
MPVVRAISVRREVQIANLVHCKRKEYLQNIGMYDISVFLAIPVEHSKSCFFFFVSLAKHENIQITFFFGNKCRTFRIALFFFAKYVEHSKLCNLVLCKGEKHAQEDK